MGRYQQEFRRSPADPDQFWQDASELIDWDTEPSVVLDVVAALPKTRSGKIPRKTMRGIADGDDEPVPSTIEDPDALDALRPLLRGG
jgi:Acetyl-coenzyme A synthetase N-terminus